MKREQDQIQKTNLKIAEFMNEELFHEEHDTKMFRIWDGNTYKLYSQKDLLYHESWDWLMPVVEMIERFNGIFISIEDTWCAVELDSYDKPMIENEDDTKIEAVYESVLDFIDWYNENFRR